MDGGRIFQCLQALNHCHQSFGGTENTVYNEHKESAILQGKLVKTNNICGPQIARLFAEQMAHTLPEDEFRSLLHFLRLPRSSRIHTTYDLDSSLETAITAFRSREIELSKDCSERLSREGGPTNADVGLILHCQSEDDITHSFWDPGSATINLTEKKGINENFCFGYDWHWRAQIAFRHRPGCPAKGWSKELQKLHNQLSLDVLDIIPLPFLIVASRCASENFRRSRRMNLRAIELNLGPGVGTIHLDLEFNRGSIRRIIVHTAHPVAGFFFPKAKKLSLALRMDASMNLILWLVGRAHDPTTFLKNYASRPPRCTWNAPLQELWKYSQQENQEKRILLSHEYSPTFIRWAGRYIGQDPSLIISAGTSLIHEVVRRLHKNRSAIQATQKTQIKPLSFNDNENRSASKLSDGTDKKEQREAKRKRAYDDEPGLPSHSKFGDIQPQAPNLAQSAMHPTMTTPNTLIEVTDDLKELPILIPDDPLCPDDYDTSTLGAMQNTSAINPPSLTSLHGSQVCVQKHGSVVLLDADPVSSLQFSISRKDAGRLLQCFGILRIFFMAYHIEIRNESSILYTKPNLELFRVASSGQWLLQLTHEHRTHVELGGPSNTRPKVCAPSRDPVANFYGSGDLRARLLQGSYFYCGEQKYANGKTIAQRVYFRGVTITISKLANPETIFIKAYLARPGDKLPKPSVVETSRSDQPASRLAIRVQSEAKNGIPSAFWLRQNGQKDVQKLNSLVDYLEGGSLDYTEAQHDRFLNKRRSKCRFKPEYSGDRL